MFTGIITAGRRPSAGIVPLGDADDMRLGHRRPHGPMPAPSRSAPRSPAPAAASPPSRSGPTGSPSTSRARRCPRPASASGAEGSRLNLERSLKVGDELGGHFVSWPCRWPRHRRRRSCPRSRLAPGERSRSPARPRPLHCIAQKGSDRHRRRLAHRQRSRRTPRFGVNIIPHTWTETTLGALAARPRTCISKSICWRATWHEPLRCRRQVAD